MATKAFSPKVRKRIGKEEPKKDVLKVAKAFVKQLDKDLGDFLKAVALFGSCATDSHHEQSDIDILVIVDDVQHEVTSQVTQHYRDIITKAAGNASPLLHVNTLKLSNFWEYCREGDPVVINMLRDGYVLHDKGFFGPVQLLLQQGRIRPTKEAIWTYYARTANTLKSARKHVLSACVDLYWAAIDASHAALMAAGEIPPSPEHVPEMLKKLVKDGHLGKQYPVVMRELYHLHKAIQHREIKEVSGKQYEGYWIETLKLVDALRTVVEMHQSNR